MFRLGLFIGVYSYLIFFLGVLGLLYKEGVMVLTVIFWGVILGWWIRRISRTRRIGLLENKLLLLFVVLFALQALINLIGVFGPEIGFDALWYHLTLPKLYLQQHSVFFIPGGLLYYSAMPKLAEMLYIAGLSFGNEITVKVIHFVFGLLTCLALYKLSRKFFTPLISFLAVVIFYANLVVGWQSIAAYIDLIRTFFEVLALWAFINWIELKKRKWFVWSAVMIGLAITTKVLAIGSLVVFVILLLAFGGWQVVTMKNYLLRAIRNIILYVLIALVVPVPWFVFSYIYTGNPVYPFFSGIYPISPSEINIFNFFKDMWILLTQAADPVSPIYLMFLPLIVWIFLRSRNPSTLLRASKFRLAGLKVIGVYSLLALVVWYFTPRTGGGRFIVPYLPAFSILCAGVINEILENKKQYGRYLKKILLGIIIFVSVISIGYRFVANYKYIPVILGKQTKVAFLSSHLNFSYGDFYDTDGYFKSHVKPTDKILLVGFHNLYYVDFPFIDSSWRTSSDTFTYVATQNTELPKEFTNWILVYENEQTMVKLYKMPERLYSLK